METLLQLVQGQPWYGIVTAVVALASAIAAATPTPRAGTFAAKVYSLIDLLAFNFGKAKETGK